MTNFKKGIALALVATTAFTFAPVSTLGLNTAVVAQAATATKTFTIPAAGTAQSIDVNLGVGTYSVQQITRMLFPTFRQPLLHQLMQQVMLLAVLRTSQMEMQRILQ